MDALPVLFATQKFFLAAFFLYSSYNSLLGKALKSSKLLKNPELVRNGRFIEADL